MLTFDRTEKSDRKEKNKETSADLFRISFSFLHHPSQSHLLLRRRPEFTGLAGGLGRTHGKGHHEFVVAPPLVRLYVVDKLI